LSVGLDLERSEQPEIHDAFDSGTDFRLRYPCVGAASPVRRIVSGMASRLTETEARVMRLAAAGLKAEEIAEALDLSRRTVAWHLAQSYRKLGLAREAPDPSHRRFDDVQT